MKDSKKIYIKKLKPELTQCRVLQTEKDDDLQDFDTKNNDKIIENTKNE